MKKMNKKIVISFIVLIMVLAGGILTWRVWPKKVETPAPAVETQQTNTQPLTLETSTSIGNSNQHLVVSSTLKLLNIGLRSTPYDRGENIAEFPLGQIFNISAIFDANNSPPEVDLRNISTEVSAPNGYVVALVELECERSYNFFNCGNNVWNTSNLSSGQKQYKFSVSGTDSLGKKVRGSIVRDFTFKNVSRNLCKAVYPQHNTDDVTENKINLVFVGSGYSDVRGESFSEVFTKVASKLIDLNAAGHGLFSVEPFKSNSSLFNFWYIDKSYPLERCTLMNHSCPREDILKLAENCSYPNSYIVQVHDRDAHHQEVGAGERWVVVTMPYHRLSDSNQFMHVDYLQRVFVHEFGHAFANLGDEYVIFSDQAADPSLINVQKLNSIFRQHKNVFYGTLNDCQQNAPWRNVPGTGCFEGAGKIGLNAFRPTENSLMRYHFLDPFTFGPYNSLLIQNTLDRFLTKSKLKEVNW